MIDVYCYIEMFKGRVGEVVEESKKYFKVVVDLIIEYRKFYVWKSWELLELYFGFVFLMFGYVFNEVRRGNWEKVKRVEEFICEYVDEIVVVGEIGFDFYYVKIEEERKN